VGADEGHTWTAACGDEVGFAGELATRARRRAAGDGNCFGYGAAPVDRSKLKNRDSIPTGDGDGVWSSGGERLQSSELAWSTGLVS
jgi:hypothetical protein